jgi:hypothetical protein
MPATMAIACFRVSLRSSSCTGMAFASVDTSKNQQKNYRVRKTAMRLIASSKSRKDLIIVMSDWNKREWC